MALRRFCDMCGDEIAMGRYLTIEIQSGTGRNDLRGTLTERDLCEDCAVKVRSYVTSWKERTE